MALLSSLFSHTSAFTFTLHLIYSVFKIVYQMCVPMVPCTTNLCQHCQAAALSLYLMSDQVRFYEQVSSELISK